jgi:hypothetical protein
MYLTYKYFYLVINSEIYIYIYLIYYVYLVGIKISNYLKIIYFHNNVKYLSIIVQQNAQQYTAYLYL